MSSPIDEHTIKNGAPTAHLVERKTTVTHVSGTSVSDSVTSSCKKVPTLIEQEAVKAAKAHKSQKPRKSELKSQQRKPSNNFHIQAMHRSDLHNVLSKLFGKHYSQIYDTFGIERPVPDPTTNATIYCRVLKYGKGKNESYALRVWYDFTKRTRKNNHDVGMDMLIDFVYTLIDVIDGEFNTKFEHREDYPSGVDIDTRQIYKITFKTLCFKVRHDLSMRKQLMEHWLSLVGSSVHNFILMRWPNFVRDIVGCDNVRALVEGQNLTPSNELQKKAWSHYIELYADILDQCNRRFIIGKPLDQPKNGKELPEKLQNALHVTVSSFTCNIYTELFWFKWMVNELPYLFQEAMEDMIAEKNGCNRAPRIITREE